MNSYSDQVSAQIETTGISWDVSQINVSLMRHVGVESALDRFREALPNLIWNAAALEGNTFTLPEARALLDGTAVQGRRIEEEQQILALSEGYGLVDELVREREFRLDKETSDRVQGLVARYEAIESGHFRGEGQVNGGGTVRLTTGGYVDGAPQAELRQRWTRLTVRLSEIPDPRLRALVYNAAATRAQYYFDGNKRTARLMMAGELMSHGFDAVNIPNSRRLEFNVALDELFQTDDATQLMAFTLSCAAPVLQSAVASLPSLVDPATAGAAKTFEAVWRRIESEFGLLSSSEVDVLLGASKSGRACASSLRQRGELLAILRKNAYVFPGFQFDHAASTIRPWVKALLTLAAEHELSSTDVTAWMMSPTTYFFASDRPADHVTDAELLLSVAERAWGIEW